MLSRLLAAKLETVGSTGCWRWTGCTDGKGYGMYGRKPGYSHRVHRRVWQELIGPIPEGLELDHFLFNRPQTGRESLCIGPACANPEHLRPVTHFENVSRTRWNNCAKGHPLDGPNGALRQGRRICRTCEAAYRVKYGRNREIRVFAHDEATIAEAFAAYNRAVARGSRHPRKDACAELGITRPQLNGRLAKPTRKAS